MKPRKEEGCKQYDLIDDIETKGVFFLIELWETKGHHRNHGGQEHLIEFRRNSAEILESSTEVYHGFKIF